MGVGATRGCRRCREPLADACEVSALDEARLAECQVVVAATGDDKVNLVVSLQAKTEFGVPRVVARVNHPKTSGCSTSRGGWSRGFVPDAFSTGRRGISVGDLVFTFRQAAELVEMTLPSTSPLSDTAPRPLIGRRTPSRLPLCGVRMSRHLTALVLEAGDELLFVAAPEREAELQTLLGH